MISSCNFIRALINIFSRNQFYFSKRSCTFSFWGSLFPIAIITFSNSLLSRRSSEIALSRGDTNVYSWVRTHPTHPAHPAHPAPRPAHPVPNISRPVGSCGPVPASRGKYVYFFHLCIQLFPIAYNTFYNSINSFFQ